MQSPISKTHRLRFRKKFIRVKSSGVLSFDKFTGLPAAFTQRITVFFGCGVVFGSIVETEKIHEAYIVRRFDGAVTNQFVVDKDLYEDWFLQF